MSKEITEFPVKIEGAPFFTEIANMPQRKVTVSPRQFDILTRELLTAEIQGHNPNDCVRLACSKAEIKPEVGTMTELVVDWTL
jgi:hypothetical protein